MSSCDVSLCLLVRSGYHILLRLVSLHLCNEVLSLQKRNLCCFSTCCTRTVVETAAVLSINQGSTSCLARVDHAYVVVHMFCASAEYMTSANADNLVQLLLQAWGGKSDNKQKAQDVLSSLAKANSEAQLRKYTGPHPAAWGGRILQALRTGSAGSA